MYAMLAGLGLLSTSCAKQKYAWSTEDEYFKVPIWKQHVKAFNKMKFPPHTATLFIGDSMTEGFDLKRHLGVDSTVNMGISGDFTSGILKRLNPVEKLQPVEIFIMIGINDILKSVPQDRIKTQYEQIITQLQKLCPLSKIYVQSNLPTTNIGGNEIANDYVVSLVRDLNAFLELMCTEKNVTFINLYPLYELNGRELNPLYTYDGLHLNDEGYVVWANQVRSLLHQKNEE